MNMNDFMTGWVVDGVMSDCCGMRAIANISLAHFSYLDS